MPALLDELKGILSAEEFAKLEGNAAMKTRLERGDELRNWYDGDEPPAANEPPPAPPRRDAPPPVSAAADIQAIERMLDSKLATITGTVETKINEAIERRGAELVVSASNLATAKADELNRVYLRHQSDFGEAFDTNTFNEFLMKPENSVMDKDNKRVGSKFPTITAAYDAMTGDRRRQKELAAAKAEGVAEGKAANSGRNLPGTTPGPMSSNVRFFTQRGRPTDQNGQPDSRVGKAATALDNLLAKREAATA